MATVKNIKDLYDFSSKIGNGTSVISCEKGSCVISSDTDILGIEIHFTGKVNIKPTLPEGWYLRGNNNKIIIFTMQNVPIKNQLLFVYEGTITLNKCVVANSEAKQIKCIVKRDESQWIKQKWSLDIEADTWDNFKDITPNGKVTKTSYIIDDDLPEADKTKIKTRRRTTTSTSVVSSGSTGGY
tara:strand:- start:594 stop:1145 length:552 start_codon:yes stop_codon:yes gene_type:complete